jgi:hypothetical protein
MKYLITRLILDCAQHLEISREEFDRVHEAKRSLLILLSLEEKLDLVLENYTEYERELLNMTLHHMVFQDLDRLSFRVNEQAISRRLINLLASGRLYVDQVQHDLTEIYGGDSEEVRVLAQTIKHEYDHTFEYRFMEALRNFVQHRSLPFQSLKYSSEWEETCQPNRLRFSIVPSLDLERLRADPRFKRSVLEELDPASKHLRTTPLVRRYVESIGTIHQVIRDITTEDAKKWDALIVDVRQRARGVFGDSLGGLALVAVEEGKQPAEAVHIFEDLTQHRKMLQKKNRTLTKLSARYVSGAAPLR